MKWPSEDSDQTAQMSEGKSYDVAAAHLFTVNTVDSRYLEFQGTL